MKRKQIIAVIILVVFIALAAGFQAWRSGKNNNQNSSALSEAHSNSSSGAGAASSGGALNQPQPFPNPDKPQENEAEMPLVPNFALRDQNGNRVELADYAGKPIVLNFWASWCTWCDEEMPHFEQAATFYADTDLVILMVNVTDGKQETEEKALHYWNKQSFNYLRCYFDHSLYASSIFGTNSLPVTFTIDREGYLKSGQLGYCDYDTLTALVEDIL